MQLSLGFSPCPNDTFIFDALVNNKFDTGNLNFDVYIKDVEELNRDCLVQRYDVCKISYHAYSKVHPYYQILHAGSALGRGVGPLLISKREFQEKEISSLRIATPGINTTANFLLNAAYGNIPKLEHVLFSDIERLVFEGEVDAGVIIHENRFTYHKRGLRLIRDLGNFWEDKTSLPIPLGGIVIRRELAQSLKDRVNLYLRKSVNQAFEEPSGAQSFVLKHAQELKEEIVEKHIETYVNSYSLNIGKEGKAAVLRMFKELGLTSQGELNESYLFV